MDEQREVILVAPYDPSWPESFDQLCSRIWPAVSDVAIRIDHVGSTAVPGLAAKPIIDLDVVVEREGALPKAIERLEAIGYEWVGDLGILGREAFRSPDSDKLIEHHLYLVVKDNRAHQDHWLLRDLLRSDPKACEHYAALKLENARRAAGDIDRYVALKANLVAELLTRARLERNMTPVTYWDPLTDDAEATDS